MLQWDQGGGSGGGSECVVLLPPHLNGELEGENAHSMCIKLNAFLFPDFFFFFFLVQHSQKAESGRLRIINFIFISIQSAPQELSGERGLINLIKITTSIIIIAKLLPLISARHRRQPLIITSCSKYLSSAKSPSGETHCVLL